MRLAHCSFRYVNSRYDQFVDFYSEPGQGEALVDLKELDYWTQPRRRHMSPSEHEEAIQRIAAFFDMNGFKLVTVRTNNSGGEQQVL